MHHGHTYLILPVPPIPPPLLFLDGKMGTLYFETGHLEKAGSVLRTGFSLVSEPSVDNHGSSIRSMLLVALGDLSLSEGELSESVEHVQLPHLVCL